MTRLALCISGFKRTHGLFERMFILSTPPLETTTAKRVALLTAQLVTTAASHSFCRVRFAKVARGMGAVAATGVGFAGSTWRTQKRGRLELTPGSQSAPWRLTGGPSTRTSRLCRSLLQNRDLHEWNHWNPPLRRSACRSATFEHADRSSIVFRGSDAKAAWIEGHVGFGHTLLKTTWESVRERNRTFWTDLWSSLMPALMDARN